MSLLVFAMALGMVPSWRGSLLGVLLGSWALAAVTSAAILSGAVDPAGLLPALLYAVLGYNIGVGMGFGLHHAVSLRAARF